MSASATYDRPIIAYYRVSTARQGESGLGLDAQREAVLRHAGSSPIIAEYTEIESGKRADREQLGKAIAHAKSVRGTLVIAKLDRLARNVAFVSSLMDSGVDFVCADQPHATRFTLHILAAVAEHEAAAISARTKAALAQAKLRGKLLGSARPGHWDGREDRRQAGSILAAQRAAAVHQQSRRDWLQSSPAVTLIRDCIASGSGLREIVARLSASGHLTRRGNRQWSLRTVARIADQLGLTAPQ